MQPPIDRSVALSRRWPDTLPAAVEANDLPLAAELLRTGADPERKDPLGYPPLCLAVALGNAQMVEMLLTAGADPLLLDTCMDCPARKCSHGGTNGGASAGVQDSAPTCFGSLFAFPTSGYRQSSTGSPRRVASRT